MKKETLFNLTLLVVVVALMCVFLEIGVRLIGVSAYDYPKGMFQNDEYTDYSLTPNFEGVFEKSEFSTVVRTNSLGFRDVEYGPKEEGQHRILALGDSFTWGGYGTDLDQIFIKVLEKKLNEDSNVEYQVINAGSPGYGTDQEAQLLMHKTGELGVDTVMVNFFVGNDFVDNLQTGEMMVKDGLLVRQKDQTTLNKIRFVMQKHSHAYRLFERAALNMFGGFIESHVRETLQDDASQRGLFVETLLGSDKMNKTLDILDDIKDYTEDKGMDLVIVLIPIKYQVEDELMETFVKNNLANVEVYDMELPQKIITKWGESRGVTVIDLLPALRGKDGLYWTLNPHLNKEGNLIAGEYLYEQIIKTRYSALSPT